MSTSRNTAGKSSHMDERKSVERNGGLEMKVTRNDRKYMDENGIADIAIMIHYPILTHENDLEYEVKHADDEQLYIYSHQELLDEGYRYKLSKLILSTKNPNHATLKPWIELHTVNITHDLPKHSVVWIKYPTADTSKDRVCMVSNYYNEFNKTLDFLLNIIPKYYIKHIDHSDEELESDNFVISTSLSNGTILVNGGEGLASNSDLICICGSNKDAKYAYLKIQLFCTKQVVEQYRKHILLIGQEAIDKVARACKSRLSAKYQDVDKSGYVDMGKELKEKEFDGRIKKATGNAPDWKGSKSKMILSIDYDDSIAIFGTKSIVKTFTVKNKSNFILCNTELTLTFYPNQSRMKIDTFVSHVWM